MDQIPKLWCQWRVDKPEEVFKLIQLWPKQIAQVIHKIKEALSFYFGKNCTSFWNLWLGQLWFELARVNERERSLKLPLGQVFVACDLEVVVQGVVDRLVVNRAILCAGFHSLANLVLLFTGKRVRCRGHFIMAVLANGGKNFGRNPTLEALGRFELGAEDQSVEARLVDAVDRLDAVELVGDFRLDEVFGINVIFDRFARVCVSKR